MFFYQIFFTLWLQIRAHTVLRILSHKISQVNCWYYPVFPPNSFTANSLRCFFRNKISYSKKLKKKPLKDRQKILLMFNHLDKIQRFEIKVHYIKAWGSHKHEMSVDCLQPKFEYSNWYLGILNVFGIRWMMHTILAIIAFNWNSYNDYT